MLTKITKQQVADIMEILEQVFDNSEQKSTGLYLVERHYLWMNDARMESLKEMLEKYKSN